MSDNGNDRTNGQHKRTWKDHEAKDWIMVRLTPDVHRQLCEARESMRTAEKNRKVPLSIDHRDRVSLNEVIRQLLAFRDHHRARSQRSAARRKGNVKAARETSGDAQGADPPSELT
jgi:hypothetical protein